MPWMMTPAPQEASSQSVGESVRMARSVQPVVIVGNTTCVQVAPASSERNTPVRVAAYRCDERLGLITILLTNRKSAVVVLASCVQVAPPFVVLKMPLPRTASMLK